jgi:hypothetical protein
MPFRVVDVERTARSLFCEYFMEGLPGGLPAAWLQRGISKVSSGDPDDLARLNRKMLASLSRGTTLASELFTFDEKQLARLMRHLDDHRNFARFEQFSDESWSVCEYLGGEHAPSERRDRGRAFLDDTQPK